MIASTALYCGCVRTNEGLAPEPTPREPPPARVVGHVRGNTYYSPQGGFAVPFPVVPQFHGRITQDDALSVTFRDNRGIRVTFYSRQFNAGSPMMTVLHKDGRQKALEILVKDIYGDTVTPHFHPDVRGGTISLIYQRPVDITTAAAIFVDQNRIYAAETDLPPGVQFLSKQEDMGALDDRLEKSAVELARSVEVR